MDQVNYSIDKEPGICAELIAEAIEANLVRDESVISWDNPIIIDAQVSKKQYEIWLSLTNEVSVNLTDLFNPLVFIGPKR